MLYATDASIYQVEPLAVVIPRNVADVRRVVEHCAAEGLAILPRGGGTSLAGQTVNRAVVVDMSAHVNRLIGVDAAARTAVVEPGLVLDRLNAALTPHGLMFGPDVATSTHANLGGMIGNNSAGAHSVLYGRTVEHLVGLDVLLADGTPLRLDAGAAERDERVRDLTRRIADAVMPLADEIDARYPGTVRRVNGYNLDLFVDQVRRSTDGTFDRVNLAHLLCGSEGTLAVTVGATLGLVERPAATGLMIVAFRDVDDALAALPEVLATGPAAVELIDDVVLERALHNTECRRYVELLPRPGGTRPGAVLYVEHFASSAEARDERLDALEQRYGAEATARYVEASAMSDAWTLRRSGEPLLHAMPGRRKPVTFIEDLAVDPGRLREFVRDFRGLMDRFGTTAAYYAHASVGCLHFRPLVDLHDEADRDLVERIAEAATDLVREYGGALSGEHGDGRLRSHLLRRFYGDAIVDAFAAVKSIFDPEHRLNPGNIVDPPAMTSSLRVRPGTDVLRVPEVETCYRFEPEHGFEEAVLQCNGAGVCRRMTGGTMCPSYRATRDERHSTRGRGNALRLAITGQTPDSWLDEETHATLDLCLSCKACKSECPSSVDVAKLKSEYLAQAHRARGRVPRRTRAFAGVRTLNRWGSRLAPLSNALARLAAGRLGVDRRRSLPRFRRSLFTWWRERPVVNADAPKVVLVADCFTTYNEPEIGRVAVEVLEAAGFRVLLPDVGCCQRPAISLGMLDEVSTAAASTARVLSSIVEELEPVAIVGCEPSCVSAIVDDWTDLALDFDPAKVRRIASITEPVESFLAGHGAGPDAPSPGPPVLLHGHCHQKALWGMDAPVELLRRCVGDRLTVLDSGCCGMAGAFGYTTDHYEISMAIGELGILPAVRASPDAVIVASGTSCRHQVRDGTGRAAIHPVELVFNETKRQRDEETK